MSIRKDHRPPEKDDYAKQTLQWYISERQEPSSHDFPSRFLEIMPLKCFGSYQHNNLYTNSDILHELDSEMVLWTTLYVLP